MAQEKSESHKLLFLNHSRSNSEGSLSARSKQIHKTSKFVESINHCFAQVNIFDFVGQLNCIKNSESENGWLFYFSHLSGRLMPFF